MGYPGRSIIPTIASAMALLWCGFGFAEPIEMSSFSGLVTDREPGSRLCIDMDGHFFEWKWGNIPFASSCIESRPPKRRATASEPEACYFDCSNAWLSCQTSILDGDQPKTCLDDLEACMSRCKGGSDAAARDWMRETP